MFLKDYRMIFTKTGMSKYISHLDLNRCMFRAIRRSGLPAWYTEGFHPHLYLMFPLALPLGVESLCEIMDFRLNEERPEKEILEKLNAELPEGIQALTIHEPKMQAQEIISAEYQLCFRSEMNLLPLWENFMQQPEIFIEKKTKKGMIQIDIHPLMNIKHMTSGNQKLCLTLQLPAGSTQNVNILTVAEKFQKCAFQAISIKNIRRTKIFSENFQEFF